MRWQRQRQSKNVIDARTVEGFIYQEQDDKTYDFGSEQGPSISRLRQSVEKYAQERRVSSDKKPRLASRTKKGRLKK